MKRLRFFSELLAETFCVKLSEKNTVQFARSLIVSVISLIVDFGVLVALKEFLELQYLLAATIGFSIGVIVNYVISIAWVFPDRKIESRHKEFMIFVGICFIGLLLNLVIMYTIVDIGKVDYKIAKAISTIVVFFWNFIVRKKILY